MTEYYLWLLQLMGAANPRSIALLKHYGSADKVYEAVQNGETRFLKPAEFRSLKSASLEHSFTIMEYCKKVGAKIITIDDSDYPELLRNIYNAPILLFVIGNLNCLNAKLCINIIGTRKPTNYSLKVARIISKKLAETDFVVVSGFASGIDRAAQNSAVDAGGKTVGVMACGIDVDYPAGIHAFIDKIVKSNRGAAISELLPGRSTSKTYFHLRNRIMSGLSHGTLIVEAGNKSGCHITADCAVSQNRDLFCVPPQDVFLERYSGVIRYLRDGAIPVFSYIDILQQYKSELELMILENEATESDDNEYIDNSENNNGGTNASEKAPLKLSAKIIAEQPPKADYSALPPQQFKIARLLNDGAKTLDYIAQNSEMNLTDISDVLLDMELDGIVENLPGARYKLK